MRAIENKLTVTGVMSLALLMICAGPASAVPIVAQYIDDPRCDPVPNQQTTHELGDFTAGFPIDESFDVTAVHTNVLSCEPDDGISNDWEVRITNLGSIFWQDLFFVADGNVSVGNADGSVINPFSAADPPTDAFKIDGTVTITGGNDALISESAGINEIFEPGETWTFLVSNYMPLSGIFPPSFGSVGAYGVASNSNPLSNASILASPVPEPASMLLLAGAGLAFLRRRRYALTVRKRKSPGGPHHEAVAPVFPIHEKEINMISKEKQIRLAGTIGCLFLLITATARAQQTFDVVMTADNAYAIYLGDAVSATSMEGSATNLTAGQIWSPETYSLTAPDLSYIYIAAWSDDVTKQGLLADFNNLTLGGSVLSGDPQWDVTATGINLGNIDPPPTLPNLSAQIVLANAGSNPSGGWVTPTASPLNNAAGGIHGVTIAGIDPLAHWMWYDSGLDGSPNAPFDGFNHQEYLIFRIPVTAPEPTTAGLILLGGVAMLTRRRRPRNAGCC